MGGWEDGDWRRVGMGEEGRGGKIAYISWEKALELGSCVHIADEIMTG